MATDLAEFELTVNGAPRTGVAEPRMLLSDFLRHGLGFTGVHVGCEHGVCGACTVLLDDAPVRSCLMFAVQAKRHRITTIEGIASDDAMHQVQQAFKKNHGLQCGFCTPGMVLTVIDFLQRERNPTDRDVREGISGNLCRCTGYEGIVAAVLEVAKALEMSETASERTEARRRLETER